MVVNLPRLICQAKVTRRLFPCRDSPDCLIERDTCSPGLEARPKPPYARESRAKRAVTMCSRFFSVGARWTKREKAVWARAVRVWNVPCCSSVQRTCYSWTYLGLYTGRVQRRRTRSALFNLHRFLSPEKDGVTVKPMDQREKVLYNVSRTPVAMWLAKRQRNLRFQISNWWVTSSFLLFGCQ